MTLTGFLFALIATLMSIAGDYFLKRSAIAFTWPGYAMATLLYAASTAPWWVAMRHAKLVALASVYPALTIICITLLGVGVFKEHVGLAEWVALALSLMAVIIMSQFSA